MKKYERKYNSKKFLRKKSCVSYNRLFFKFCLRLKNAGKNRLLNWNFQNYYLRMYQVNINSLSSTNRSVPVREKALLSAEFREKSVDGTFLESVAKILFNRCLKQWMHLGVPCFETLT